MSDIWAFLLQTGAASLAAAMLLLVKRLFLDKLSPRWQYGIWALLGLRLLLPAGLGGRYVLLDWQLVLEWVKTGVESGLSSALAGPYTLTRVLAPVPIFPRGLPAPGSFTDLLFYVYAAGAAACLGWYLLSYLRLRLALNAGRPAGAARLDQIRRVCARYGLRPPRRVVEAQGLGSAFVCSPLRPVLALPAGVEVDDKVILHELLHLRYGDVWAGVLVCVLRCLHWCNPLIWYCCDRAQNDCEALCDQRVLERLEGEARRDYGRILLSMADGRYARAPGTSSMANGGRNIKRRIGSIARFKRYPRGMALVSVCVAVVLCLGCVTGSSPARSADFEGDSLNLGLARARLARASTVAGALDTYAKALLYNNGFYLAMVTPQESLDGLLRRMGSGAPYLDGGLTGELPSDCMPGYSIHNLRPDGDGYLAVVAFPRKAGTDGLLVWEDVRIARGDGWEVTALTHQSVRLENSAYDSFSVGEYLPALRLYQASGERWAAEIAIRTTFTVAGNEIASTDWIGSMAGAVTYEAQPLPAANFDRIWENSSYTARYLGDPAQVNYAALSYLPLESGDPMPAYDGRIVCSDSSGSSTDGSGSCSMSVYDGWDGAVSGWGGTGYSGDYPWRKPVSQQVEYAMALYLNGGLDETLRLLPVEGGAP